MTDPRRITDSDLHAYVDGELDPAARREVEAWLADHPDDAAKVSAWQTQAADLGAALGPVVDEPLPPALDARRLRRPAWRTARPWLRVAAAILLFVAGGVAGWVAATSTGRDSRQTASLVGQAVGAHLVYTPEVRHPVEVAGREEAHLVAWLSKRLGRKLRAPDLSGAGFRLVGGRLLPDRSAPAAQFMYENPAGARVTVYVRTGVDNKDTALRFEARDGVSAFYWIDRGFGFALVGALPRDRLLRLARWTYRDLERR